MYQRVKSLLMIHTQCTTMCPPVKSFLMIQLILLCGLVTLAEACDFGKTQYCRFPCHCQGDEDCNQYTGECPSRCATTALTKWTGQSCQIGNVAYRKTATQGPTSQGSAGRSTDGSAENEPEDCSTARGSPSIESWWQVDLLGIHVITEVKILNIRTRSMRPTNAAIYIGNTTGSSPPTLCNVIQQAYDGPRWIFNQCNGTIVGDYVKIINQNLGEDLSLCEVEVIGHLYRVCTAGYYGPGCHQRCNCEAACDSATGHCPTQCVPGKAKPDCQEDCGEGTWGHDCLSECHCNDGTCNVVTGFCTISGCEPGYTGSKCQWQLPSMVSAGIQITAVNGQAVTLTFDPWDNTMPGHGEIRFYIVQYNNGELWHNVSQYIVEVTPVTVRLPAIRTPYHLRVMPYQRETAYEGPGIPTEVVAVYTECADGFYGSNVCDSMCNCMDQNEVSRGGVRVGTRMLWEWRKL